MDFSGFTPLMRQTYDWLAIEDAQLSRKLPYPIFQHAMVELLDAYLLHHAKYVLKVPSLQTMMDPLAAIDAANCNVPTPIYDYICGIGPAMTLTGDKVFWNLPNTAIPMPQHVHNNINLRSGTFGQITAENHNVYACYFSPYITAEYILRCGELHRKMAWNPFPAGWFPANGVVNENLLGYRELIRLHPDGVQKCLDCDFDQSESITGLLCHSPYVMTLTSGVIGSMKTIKYTKADFTARDNSAALYIKVGWQP